MATLKELLKTAEALFNNKEYLEVITLLNEQILGEFKSPDLYAWRAWASDRLDDVDATFKYSNEAIKIDPFYSKSYRIRGNAWLKKMEYDKAIIDYNKAIELNPQDSYAYNNRGNSYYKKKDLKTAIVNYTMAIQLNPLFWEPYNNRGNCYNQKGELDNALRDYNKAIEVDPKHPTPYGNIGIYYHGRGEYTKAIIEYNKAIQLNPNFTDAYNNRGSTYHNLGDYQKAIADYSKAIELTPNSPNIYTNRGNSYSFLGQYDNAIADYSMAISLDSSFYYAYNNRANNYASLGRFDDAMNDYNAAISIDSDNYLAYNNKGLLYLKKGELPKAIEEFKKAISLSPKTPNPHKNLGDILFETQEYFDALKEYEITVELEPGNNYYKSFLDKAKAKLGEAVVANPIAGNHTNNTAEYIERSLSPLTDENEKKRIRTAWVGVDEVIGRVRKLLLYTGAEDVVHYTRIKVADLLAMSKSFKLRYSNVVFMNDPDEGSVFLKYLDNDAISESMKKADQQDDNNIYLGSFLPAGKQDYLIMWRTYGKNEYNEEATGCSFLIKHNFFDSEDCGSLYAEAGKSEVINRENLHKQPLYKVVYYDRETRELLDAEGLNKRKLIEEIVNFKINLKLLIDIRDPNDPNNREKKNIILDGLVYRFISELRYFFKSSEYHFEKELRVIKYYAIEDSMVKTDSNTNDIPRKLYIESTKDVQPYLNEIILGPKVTHPERYLYIEAQLRKYGYDTILRRSELHFQ